MRIGIFSDTYLPVINGVVTSIETLRKGLIERGHDVFVISNHDKLFDIEFNDNILYLPGVHVKFLFDNNLSSPTQLRAYEIIKQMNLDLIHVHTEFGIGLFGRSIAKKESLPMVTTYHTQWEDYTHYVNPIHSKSVDKVAKSAVAKLSKMLYNQSAQIITPTNKTKELLIKYNIFRPISVIPTGVDLEKFKKTDAITLKVNAIKEQFNLSDDDTIFVFIGRLGEEKNLSMVIDAMSEVSFKVKLLIVGDGPEYSKIEKKIEKEQLTNIKLVGRVPNVEIAAYYHVADCFVSASLSETQGLTFIEAEACGLPLFASDKEVLAELLYEGQNGYFFDDKEELIEKINQYLSLTSDEKEAMSQRSLELVKPYDKNVFVDRIIDLYQQVLATKYDNYIIVRKEDLEHYSLLRITHQLEELVFALDKEFVKKEKYTVDRLLESSEIAYIKNNDEIVDRFNFALKKLSNKDYSAANMKQLLDETFEVDKEVNLEVLIKLEEKQFIKDERFINELINKYQNKGYGSIRIQDNLEKYDFDEALLNSELEEFQENQSSRLDDLLENLSFSSFKGSMVSVRNKIKDKLIRLGYPLSLVSEKVKHLSLNYNEYESCFKDYLKLSKKYDLVKVKQKLLQKGYAYETVSEVMKEENNED